MLIVLACACAPDSDESEIDCEAAAVPLLPLEDDEDAYLAGRADDDWVFEVRTWPSDLDDIAAGEEAMLPIAHRVVTVSGCGDEVRVVGESLESLQAPPRADMPWIARTLGIESRRASGSSTRTPTRRWFG
jgi:hypothetical protein